MDAFFNYIQQGRKTVSDFINESKDIVSRAIEGGAEKMKTPENQNVKDEIATSIKEHGVKFHAVLDDFMKRINEQIKSQPSVSNAYESVQNKIKETTSALSKAAESAGSGDYKKFTDEFVTSWTKLTNEMLESISKLDLRKIKEEELEPLYRNAVEKITSIAKELEKAIDDITKKK